MKPALQRVIFILFFLFGIGFSAAEKKTLLESVKAFRETNAAKIISEYIDFLSIPNVSSDRTNIRINARFIREMMERRGIEVSILETSGNPIVLGKLNAAEAEHTLMFYAHYDGQPVDPSHWTDTHPFKPMLRSEKLTEANQPTPFSFASIPEGGQIERDWRIYARGASDDKAPIMALMSAMDAIIAANISFNNNLIFLFEGEEEAGSAHLAESLRKHRDSLKADLLFICDGPVYFSGSPTLYFGVRGITTMEITVYGPSTSLHSGHYGNWAPNPALRLSRLLAGMKDKNDRVTIAGFYDSVEPLGRREELALQSITAFDEQLKRLYGFSATEGGGEQLLRTLQRPSLNIRGLRSGWVGSEARTIVPSTAIASLDIRLSKGNAPADMREKIINHVKAQGYYIVDTDPDEQTRMKYPLIAKISTRGGGYRAERTSMELPICRKVIRALENYRQEDTVLLPTLGGSVPLYLFTDILDVPTIGLPIVNHDNNQHQPDENLRVGHLWNGIETMAALLLLGNSE